jgi:hypothetical protein
MKKGKRLRVGHTVYSVITCSGGGLHMFMPLLVRISDNDHLKMFLKHSNGKFSRSRRKCWLDCYVRYKDWILENPPPRKYLMQQPYHPVCMWTKAPYKK